MSNLIDGNAIAAQIRLELQASVKEIQETYGVTPGLAVVLVGARRDSATYVRMKKKACAEVGVASFGYDFPAETTQEELLAKIDELNEGLVQVNIALKYNVNFCNF
jgi:5,10-methylene-tetrahydrofolate dehydrogenase/methenyl tetrahydrofolate cyclohydrolase